MSRDVRDIHYSPDVGSAESKPLKKKSDFPAEYLMAGFVRIGKGTFNHVFRVKGMNVCIRVSEVPNSYRDVQARNLRGDAILNILNQEGEKTFGPSLLKLIERTIRTTQLPPQIAAKMPAPDKSHGKISYWVQVIEYLQEKPTPCNGVDEWWFYAFSLLWFLSTAQREVGFIHRDLKLLNMGVRKMFVPPGKTLTFRLGNDYEFSFPNVTRCPVIFDYDFGVAEGTTLPQNMNRSGTLIWVPPELVAKKGRAPAHYWGYDMYALGLCLIFFGSGVDMIVALGMEMSEYAAEISTLLKETENANVFEALVVAGAVNHIFNDEKIIPREVGIFSDKEYQFFFVTHRELLLRSIDKLLAQVQIVSSSFDQKQRELIGKLVNWRPEVRHANGNTFKLLEEYFPSIRPKKRGTADYSYSKGEEEKKERDDPFLMCSICSAPTAAAQCHACDVAYCSIKCSNHDWYFRGHHKIHF